MCIRVPLSENFFWNHRFSVREWYQVSWARSLKHWVESRSCQNSIFSFSPLPIKTPFKGMKTVNKFISIDIIFVQTAFNWANTCVYTIYWVDTFKPILATSRVILELNPFGILIRGTILTGRPMVPCVLKNSKKSIWTGNPNRQKDCTQALRQVSNASRLYQTDQTSDHLLVFQSWRSKVGAFSISRNSKILNALPFYYFWEWWSSPGSLLAVDQTWAILLNGVLVLGNIGVLLKIGIGIGYC